MRQKSEKPMSKRERRRLVRLSVSGILLVLVVAVKLLMPDLANAYKDKLLNLMGEDTDIVEAFSAMGKAFSKEGGIRDTLEDAYTAVFGEKNRRRRRLLPRRQRPFPGSILRRVCRSRRPLTSGCWALPMPRPWRER